MAIGKFGLVMVLENLAHRLQTPAHVETRTRDRPQTQGQPNLSVPRRFKQQLPTLPRVGDIQRVMSANSLRSLARPERFELPTPWFVGRFE